MGSLFTAVPVVLSSLAAPAPSSSAKAPNPLVQVQSNLKDEVKRILLYQPRQG